MESKLIIKGMHCDACKELIRLELEENGYGDKIKSIMLSTHMTGVLQLKNVSASETEQIKTIINNLENYEIND